MPALEYLLTALAGAAAVGLALGIVQILPARLTDSVLPPDQTSPGQARAAALDGLRACLALGVVIQHAWVFRDHYFTTHSWARPHNPFAALAGNLAVLMFFMITGYLFWTKAIAARGRLQVVPFFLSRARRILPLYYFFCGLVLLIILLGGATDLSDAPGGTLREILSLVIPGRRLAGPLLGTERHFLMGHVWTLYYEVYFYLFLPVLGLAARTRPVARGFILIVFGLLAYERVLTREFDYPLLAFLAGIAAAELLAPGVAPTGWLRSRALGLIVVLATPCLPCFGHGDLNPLAFACGATAFFAIAAGNDLLGLLSLRCTRLVGQASYSVYLLHLPLLYVLLNALNGITPVHQLGPLAYSAVVTASVLVVVATSMVTYRFIEKPWLFQRGRAATGLAMPAPKTG